MSNARAPTLRAALPCLVAAWACICAPEAGSAQGGGHGEAAFAGGALGAMSGLTLGLVGGMPPCSLSLDGARCARVSAALGGVIGMAGGAVLGYHDPGALRARAVGAGVGAGAGVALGLAARGVVRQVEPRDVVALALAGAALGSAPLGAAVGLGAGLLAGSALWLTLPDYGLPETLAMGVVGVALGGLMEWAYAAVAEADGVRPLALQLRIGL